MQEHARALKARGVTTVIDPGQGLPLFDGPELTELLDGADLYIVNDYEWALTLDRTGRPEAEIVGRVGGVVVTRGEKGSTLLGGGRQTEIPAVPAERVVDPTGCGDAYRAGLLHGMLRGLPLETCARIGSLLGSMMVECEGTQSLRIDPDAFRARYAREFGTAY
jgi:adenosine kinase